MRKAFTLIELMIVIAIIAIIAAIAIPNLLESRITANEAAAASSLKSGLFPAQTQYQTGGYVDNDVDATGALRPDGRGVYACHVALLSTYNSVAADSNGVTAPANAANRTDNVPSKPISLLDPKFNNFNGQAGGLGGSGTIQGAAVNSARVGAYDFYIILNCAASNGAPLGPDEDGTDGAGTTLTISAEDEAESYWGGMACPMDTTGNQARRIFGINATGTVFQSKGDLILADTRLPTVLATMGGAGVANQFWVRSPRGALGTNNPGQVGGSVPFQK